MGVCDDLPNDQDTSVRPQPSPSCSLPLSLCHTSLHKVRMQDVADQLGDGGGGSHQPAEEGSLHHGARDGVQLGRQQQQASHAHGLGPRRRLHEVHVLRQHQLCLLLVGLHLLALCQASCLCVEERERREGCMSTVFS